MSEMARKADTGNSRRIYERRSPEQTLLYQLVAEHYPRLLEQAASRPHFAGSQLHALSRWKD